MSGSSFPKRSTLTLWRESLQSEQASREGVAAALLGMGNIHRARREYTLAEEQYRKALVEFEALQDRDQVAGLLEYIGFAQHSAGKLAGGRGKLPESISSI